MIKINPDPTFTESVEITVPGKRKTDKLELTFKYRGLKEYSAWIDSYLDKKADEGKTTAENNTQVLREFVIGWGLEEPFEEKEICSFLNNYPNAFIEIFNAYKELLLESRVKN